MAGLLFNIRVSLFSFVRAVVQGQMDTDVAVSLKYTMSLSLHLYKYIYNCVRVKITSCHVCIDECVHVTFNKTITYLLNYL